MTAPTFTRSWPNAGRAAPGYLIERLDSPSGQRELRAWRAGERRLGLGKLTCCRYGLTGTAPIAKPWMVRVSVLHADGCPGPRP